MDRGDAGDNTGPRRFVDNQEVHVQSIPKSDDGKTISKNGADQEVNDTSSGTKADGYNDSEQRLEGSSNTDIDGEPRAEFVEDSIKLKKKNKGKRSEITDKKMTFTEGF